MTRLFTGYASGARADQTQPIKVKRRQKRTLVVNFAAVAGPLASVTWECTSPWITFLSNPTVEASRPVTTVDVEFNLAGRGSIKATATDTDGSVYNYEFEVTVCDAPLYPSATYSNVTGPYSVTVENP